MSAMSHLSASSFAAQVAWERFISTRRHLESQADNRRRTSEAMDAARARAPSWFVPLGCRIELARYSG